jgi:hypothetical protein
VFLVVWRELDSRLVQPRSATDSHGSMTPTGCSPSTLISLAGRAALSRLWLAERGG